MRQLKISERLTSVQSINFQKYLVDVSNIPLFTLDEEIECAIKASNGDQLSIDELVKRNLRFVISVAKQYIVSNVSLEDLVNEGNIGLIMAARRFEPEKGFKFISYAVYWIRKVIMEYLSKNNHVVNIPATRLNCLSKLNKCINELEQKFGRSIEISEVIENFPGKFSEIEISEFGSVMSFGMISLDISINEDGSSNLYDVISDKNVLPTDNLIMDNDLKKRIKSLLNVLTPRDRQIIVDLFGLDGGTQLTLKEVGEKIGMTSETVRQIKEKSIKKLKINYR